MFGKFEIYPSGVGMAEGKKLQQYRWRLKATNGQIIATGGESYSSKQACKGGIASVRRNAVFSKTIEVES